MTIRAIIDARGFENMSAQIAANMRNRRVMMRSISGVMADAVEENFRVEGRPRWPRRSLSTTIARVQEGKLGRILQVSGQLAASVSRRSNENEAAVGTNKKYARIHQMGGVVRRGVVRPKRTKTLRWYGPQGKPVFRKSAGPATIRIPARPFLALTAGDYNMINDIVRRHIVKGI